MESLGTISEREWNSFSGVYSTEEADFMAQLLSNCSLPNEVPENSSFGAPSTFWHGHESFMNIPEVEEGLMYSSDNISTNLQCFSQASSYSGGCSFIFSTSKHESYHPSDYHHLLTDSSSVSMDFCMEKEKNLAGSHFQVFTDNLPEMDKSGGSLTETVHFGNSLELKRESEVPISEPPPEDKYHHPSEKTKKRSRVSGDVQKKSNVKPKKNQKLVETSNNDGDTNAGLNRQSSSSYCSEDESNASQEFNGGVTSSTSPKGASALNLNGKSRTSRGSASDPQSLYARKRRERINERLRILQTLVPNGTKVDISTMLEEAVQYVKFLQLQIKLLSSDDMWMYAPIAYNGMNIGLDLNITMPR